jgi:hypothetical protein
VKELFKRWFNAAPATSGTETPKRSRASLPLLVMREDVTLPIVNWEAMDAHAPATEKREALDEFWTAVAEEWLTALGRALGDQYAVRESERFLLLSPLEGARARALLDYVERTRKRILHVLDGIARESDIGKVCLLILGDYDRYYTYVSNYYPPEGEFSTSGGMFLQYGYGHFVFVADDMQVMEPTIAHELTHCLMQHLSLPAWVNEGIAVNTEHRLSPPRYAPLHTPQELHEKHLEFWDDATIQEFWSGKSWRRPGDPNMLSYDLATHFVSMASENFDAFRAFANAADIADSADAAAQACLGYPVSHLAEAILGEGPWQPRPETWKDGVELGRFDSETLH